MEDYPLSLRGALLLPIYVVSSLLHVLIDHVLSPLLPHSSDHGKQQLP